MTITLDDRATRLRLVADVIEAAPESHAQDLWLSAQPDCGVKGCIAGWATVLFAGFHLHHDYDGDPEVVDSFGDYGPQTRPPHWWVRFAGGLLGLTYREAAWMFSDEWEPDDGATVPEALRAFAEGAQIVGPDRARNDFYDEAMWQARRGLVASVDEPLPLPKGTDPA